MTSVIFPETLLQPLTGNQQLSCARYFQYPSNTLPGPACQPQTFKRENSFLLCDITPTN